MQMIDVMMSVKAYRSPIDMAKATGVRYGRVVKMLRHLQRIGAVKADPDISPGKFFYYLTDLGHDIYTQAWPVYSVLQDIGS